MKYIFVTGAPGSKWSSVVKHINSSPDLDRTDIVSERSYAHRDQYGGQPMHIGAYWDPGMEFDFPENIESMSRDEIETIFDQPFSGPGIRIVKSHTLAHHIDFVREMWPDSPIVLVHRSDDACFGWWVRCGGFDISYPTYQSYYRDLPNMARQIDRQNADILRAWHQYTGNEVNNNYGLAHALGIGLDLGVPVHDYASADIKVKILAPANKP